MTSCRVSTKHLCFSSDALSHEPAMPRHWASILHLSILYRGSGLELAYIEALMHFIILHCPRLQAKLVAVTCQEYECSLFSKRVNKDSALRNCTSLVIPLVCPHPPPPNFAQPRFNFSWVLQSSQRKLKTMCILGLQPRTRRPSWWSIQQNFFSKNVHENKVQFPEDRNAFVLDHQHGGCDFTSETSNTNFAYTTQKDTHTRIDTGA